MILSAVGFNCGSSLEPTLEPQYIVSPGSATTAGTATTVSNKSRPLSVPNSYGRCMLFYYTVLTGRAQML